MARSGNYTLRGIARELKTNPSRVRDVCLQGLSQAEYQEFVSIGKKAQTPKNPPEVSILLDKDGKLVSVKGAPYVIYQECSRGPES